MSKVSKYVPPVLKTKYTYPYGNIFGHNYGHTYPYNGKIVDLKHPAASAVQHNYTKKEKKFQCVGCCLYFTLEELKKHKCKDEYARLMYL